MSLLCEKFNDNAMYRVLVQSIVDYAIYMLDSNGIILNWNAGAERTKGYNATDIVGKSFECFYNDEDRVNGRPHEALMKARINGSFENEGWRVRRDGAQFWAHVIIDPVYDHTGSLIGYAKVVRDLSEKKRRTDEAEKSAGILSLALNSMSQGLILFNKDERIAICNVRARELLEGVQINYRAGSSLRSVIESILQAAGWDAAAIDANREGIRRDFLKKLSNTTCTIREDAEFRGKILEFSNKPLPDGGWLTTIEDITQRRKSELQVIYLAGHDPLTGFANRAAVQPAINKICYQADEQSSCAILCIDLDRFKPVNDSYGHAVGDHVLRTVATRIQNELRNNDVVVRLGGDEFAIIAVGCAGTEDSHALADRIIRSISRPIRLDHGFVHVGASVGTALMPADGRDSESLLQKADLALYSAKESGRGRVHAYHPSMEACKRQRSVLERELREALAAKAFVLHYQPVICAANRAISGFEALIRWTSPSQGPLSPDTFVPFAEEIGLMPDIDDWVLQQACADAILWPEHITISVNVSSTQFHRLGLVKRVSEALISSGLHPSRLELEITETAAIYNLKEASETLQAIRTLGVGVALDDFGTGHSSLSLLRSLPFSRIKIDRSFVEDLETNDQSAAIVQAVCNLCRKFGVRATAEGVETVEQAQRLFTEGCTELQGYLFGKPMPLTDTVANLSHA